MKRIIGAAALAALLVSCQGWRSSEPPVRAHLNMVNQPKYTAQSLSLPAPEGTVPYGSGRTANPASLDRAKWLKEDSSYWTGKNGGAPVARVPVPVTAELLTRGRERFDIYCLPCHGADGNGDTPVTRAGMMVPKLYSDKVAAMPDGEVFDIITRGVRTMPAYDKQIPASDRWAIVTHVRVLQSAWKGNLSELNAEAKASLSR